MRQILFYGFLSLFFLVIHATLVNYLTIGNAIPDILIIWVVYIAVTSGQMSGLVAGFLIGLFVDFISGGVLGLSALTKTLVGFLAGYFFNENKIEQNLSTWRFVIAVGLAALLHNAIYFLIFLQGTDVGWWRALVLHGIPSTLYTTVLAMIPMFIFRRKYQ